MDSQRRKRRGTRYEPGLVFDPISKKIVWPASKRFSSETATLLSTTTPMSEVSQEDFSRNSTLSSDSSITTPKTEDVFPAKETERSSNKDDGMTERVDSKSTRKIQILKISSITFLHNISLDIQILPHKFLKSIYAFYN